MKKLAAVGHDEGDRREFMEMTSQDTLPDILNFLQVIFCLTRSLFFKLIAIKAQEKLFKNSQ